MQADPARGLLYFLQQVADPRGRQGQRHPLTAMLAASVCAVLCGARGFDAIAQWIHLQDLSFWHQLGGKRRPPCANAFRYLLNALDPEILEVVLLRYFAGLTVEETSKALDVSPRTVESDWAFARAWLHRELKKGDTSVGKRRNGDDH